MGKRGLSSQTPSLKRGAGFAPRWFARLGGVGVEGGGRNATETVRARSPARWRSQRRNVD